MGGKFWCIRDVCGLFCVFFTWLLILYAEFVSKQDTSAFSKTFWDVFSMLLDRFVVLRVILYSHPNKVFSVINGLIFQVLRKDCDFEIVLAWNCAHSKFWWYHSKISLKGLAFLAVSSHLRTMLTDPGMKTIHTFLLFEMLSPYIVYVTGAVPKGNATKENIQRMGFEEGQVNFLKILFYSFNIYKFLGYLQMP